MSRAWVTARLNGLGYTCFWIDPDKKQRQKTFNLKADAQVFRGKKQRELDTGTYLEAERGAETVVSLFERWATSRGVENSSVRQYRSMLNQAVQPFFKAKATGALKLADVQEWILWMRDVKMYAPQTLQTRFGYLSSALRWAVDNDELGRNPATRAKLPGRRANVRRKVKGKIVVPALDEIRALIAVFDPRYVAMVWVMAGCGLRIAEAMGLCADQVDFCRGGLHVDRQVTEDGETESGKNAGLRLKMYTKHRDAEDPGRTVPLPRIVADVLRTHLDQLARSRGDRLTVRSVCCFPTTPVEGCCTSSTSGTTCGHPRLPRRGCRSTALTSCDISLSRRCWPTVFRSPMSRSGWVTPRRRSPTSITGT
ncbi:hypothetical protein AB0F72_10895 [Actinoplanes sp. NPDC023936]|uniref:tyrosine-type recombinase/integrase n=1 Tax=Actinoplanes sp. NPDC023936 TaxID=3154910 RepID=UPI0033DF4C44